MVIPLHIHEIFLYNLTMDDDHCSRHCSNTSWIKLRLLQSIRLERSSAFIYKQNKLNIQGD